MVIDLDDALGEYRDRAGSAADKLVRRYKAKGGKLAAMTSDDAQKNYREAMADAKVLERRRTNLKKLTEDKLNQAMETKGAGNYRTGVAAGADSWREGFRPYAQTLDGLKLPARSRDPRVNLDKRAGAVLDALVKKKQEIG